MKKTKKWLKPRHKFFKKLVFYPFLWISKFKYGMKIERFREEGGRPYLILMNHTTLFDQFFVSISFKQPIYFVASEDIFSNGWTSSLIRYMFAPISIKKQSTDAAAVKNIFQVAKEGGTICIAPEGNRSYDGKTCYISPTIARVARKLKLPIALYRIEGGFGVHPRWSDTVRKGPGRSYVSKVIEPEEYAELTDDELYEAVRTGIFMNEGVSDALYKSSKRAENIERVLYICPDCGLSHFKSRKNEFWCTGCNRKITYNEDKSLSAENGDFPFHFLTEWYNYMGDFVLSMKEEEYAGKILFRDTACIYRVIPEKKKVLLHRDTTLSLMTDRIRIGEGENAEAFAFSGITAAAAVGKNKANLYIGKDIYQLKGDKSFNALKYVNLIYRYKQKSGELTDGQFLGL